MQTNVKKIVTIAIIVTFFLFIITYGFFRAKDLIFGVKIKSVLLDGQRTQSGVTMPNSFVKITGNAKNAVKLTLDGREISIDKSGNFDETIALLAGYNIVDIRAEDKFGHVDEKDYQLIY